MKWAIVAVGRPKLGYARTGVEEYAGRIRRFTELEFVTVPAGNSATEGETLRRRSEGSYRIVLDERGEAVTSRVLAEKLREWELTSVRKIAVLIGGADGHSEETRAVADWTWSLSPLTLQHELAQVVLLEQLYRAYTINAGLPYHRD